MGPVKQNQIQRTVSLFICVCIALCTIVAHNIAQNRPDSFPLTLHTITTAQMMSIWGKGVIWNNDWNFAVLLISDTLDNSRLKDCWHCLRVSMLLVISNFVLIDDKVQWSKISFFWGGICSRPYDKISKNIFL